MSQKPLIKICGLKDPANIREVASVNPQYMGFIFYPSSARFVGELDLASLANLASTKKTAVFVDASIELIKEVVNKYQFDAVQLHGNESPQHCLQVKSMGVEAIKAFGLNADFDFTQLEAYLDAVDYFLFDTKTELYGGSGKSFNWEVLKKYPYAKKYFLSGGIGIENFKEAYTFEDERLYAIDLNSRFEVSPGIKNIKLLEQVLNNI